MYSFLSKLVYAISMIYLIETIIWNNSEYLNRYKIVIIVTLALAILNVGYKLVVTRKIHLLGEIVLLAVGLLSTLSTIPTRIPLMIAFGFVVILSLKFKSSLEL